VLRALRDRYVEMERWAHAAAVQEALLAELRNPEDAERERQFLTVLRHQAAIGLPDVAARVRALEALADRRGVSVPIAVSLGQSLLDDGRRDEAWAVWDRARSWWNGWPASRPSRNIGTDCGPFCRSSGPTRYRPTTLAC
jgi:hypothetical protein